MIAATDAMAKLNPAFISVTYGAGGGTSKNTAKIASHIKDDLGVVSHCTLDMCFFNDRGSKRCD